MTNHRREYRVRAEAIGADDLRRTLTEIEVLAADLAACPRASEADALLHLAADVLLTLQMGAVGCG